MSGTGPLVTLAPQDWDAVLFDLDGVLTRTADVHARAWKKLFDDFLALHARQSGTDFTPFDIEIDYRRYVDGKPRYDGVISFLSSRGITLPFDAPAQTPDAPSVHALGARKDRYFLNFRMPEITRSLLMYRYRRLGEARLVAAATGLRGGMFPWQSGSDGQEETQELNLNHLSQGWIPDNSFRQRHVGSAIAYNVWQYYQVTHDLEFLVSYGAELILSIALFWSSLATFNAERGRYEIRGVMGPDEYHERYPGCTHFGLDHNAYTNIMAVWVLRRAHDVLEVLSDTRRVELMRALGVDAPELARWEDISRRMFVPFHDGYISQFEGYEHLAELDWDRYRLRYGNIQRLDLILEAENDSTNRYKLAKQADVLMLFYVFSAEELAELLEGLGYPYDREMIPRNVAYYDTRSSHGSTLSRVVHAWVLARSDRARSTTCFAEALQSDVSDIQQGTTAEGVHLGAMAGTVDLFQRVATGIEIRGDVLRFNPRLPGGLARLDMRIRYRGHSLDMHLTRETLTVRGRERGIAPIRMGVGEEVHEFACGSTRTFRLT